METPFDKLDEIKDEGQTSTEAMVEEQPAEGGPPPPPTNARVFDFRHGEVPQGVTVIGETKLEEQRDRSTALVVPPQTFLNCKLDLSPNGGVNINDYTLIMDVWLEDLPKDSLSLYQANYQQRPTEGEAYIIKTGGVGIFGEYGVREAWVRPKRWTRIVVTVGGSPRCMTTYVNGKLCAKVEKGVFHTADGRFAVNTESIMLFNSTKESFMPGVKVKYVEFRPFMMTLEAVKESAQLNRIYSFWEVEKEQEEQRKFEHLSLQSLYKRPPPVWIHPAFLGEFGDAFLEGTGLEGGSLYPSFAVFSMAIENGLKEQREFLNDLQHTDAQSLDAISEIFKESRDLARKFALAAKGGAQLVHFMRHFSKLVEALKEGETMVVPGGLNEHCLIYILERQEQTFRFVLINTDPLLGLSYHQATAQQAPKIKYKTCMALDNIPASRVLDDGFWALLFKLVTYASKHNTPDKIYDLLIPFLVNKPLEEALVETVEDPDIDWRSPQRASTAYFRSVLEAFHYLMRRKGLTPLKAKLVSLAIRVQMLSMVDNDLRFVESLSDSDVRLIKMACEQVAYTAVKYTDEKVENGFNAHQLAQIKKRLDDIESAVALLPRDNEASINPPPLELNDGDKCDYQWSHHPFFDRLLREEDVDGLAGAPIRLPKYVPVDLLQLPGRVDTFEDALAAIRYCDKMCTLISVQSHTIKNTSFLKCGLIEHTFTQVVPVPKPRTSPDYKNCVWAIPLRYALQLDILILLRSCARKPPTFPPKCPCT
ncbi:Component of oligomeric Golgi complex 3 [Balamuthia mandrillaris]